MTGNGLCLQLDVGNSSAKWRLMVADECVTRGRYCREDVISEQALLACAPHLEQIWVASVAGNNAEKHLTTLLVDRWGVTPWFARTPASTGGLRNSYREPGSMGVDRWLAMLGAWNRTAERCCVIDSGSALTIDRVATNGQHEGGYIIPGAALMERALLLDTDRVRFDEEVDYALVPGTSTAEAVRHGIALAQAGAVQLALRQCGEQGVGALYFCGGGALPLMELLDVGGSYVPDLVFEGLEALAKN